MHPTDTEAVVLQSFPFKEYDRILTLFSPLGILKLFVKGRKRDYLQLTALSSPLTHGEFHYTLGRRELHRMNDGTIINQNLRIRECFGAWTSAEKMVSALLLSQWPGKPATRLFQLFTRVLSYLPESADPQSLSTAFLLKILRHEGVLELCTPLQPTSRFAGERYSPTDAPQGALSFSEEEEETLAELALSRSLTHLSEQKLSSEFHQKIGALFSQAFG